MKVSFIIPVYKVEAYLSQCVESILTQTYVDFEILLVDDGSPDNCPALCDEWVKRDGRIKTFHKPNGGLSDARNYGLERAEGEYIVFMDSDDFWIGTESLEKLMQILVKYPNVDFIGFNCFYYYEVSDKYVKWPSYGESLMKEQDKNKLIEKLVATGTFPMSACLKIIRRDFLFHNQLYFQKGLLSEDVPWFLNLLFKCQSFKMINEYIYAYRQADNSSITHSFSYKNFDDLLGIIEKEVDNVQSIDIPNMTKHALLSFLAYEFCILLGFLCKLPDRKERAKRRRALYQYKWLLVYQKNPKVYKIATVVRILGLRGVEFILSLFVRWRW